jgi:multiple sugar transport system ATP-binding protein
MAAVTFRQVRKVYSNGHVAVDRADFTVADGELLVLVGPSGCGKSTLLRLIAGLEQVTEGAVLIGDRDVTNLEPRDRDIAMVFQSYALYPHMTVEENLGFGLKLRGHSPEEVRQRVQQSAATLELTEFLERRPRQLSGGQRQRVALGRALVRKPKVFLLDEPLSNLDAKLRGSMRTEIARLHRSLATTMVYVTHDQVEAMTLGQRIVVLDKGIVQQIDAPMRLYDHPVNLFVAGFVGHPAMNFFKGRYDSAGHMLVGVNGSTLPLAGPRADGIPAGMEGREIVVGIRPEDLTLAKADTDPNRLRLSVTVELIESIGNEAFLHGRVGAWQIIARVPPRNLPEGGAAATLCFATEKLHFFDAASGCRIEQS